MWKHGAGPPGRRADEWHRPYWSTISSSIIFIASKKEYIVLETESNFSHENESNEAFGTFCKKFILYSNIRVAEVRQKMHILGRL